MREEFDTALESFQAGDLDTARALFESILQRHPAHPDVLNLLALIEMEHGRFEDASVLLRRVISVAGQVPEFHCHLGNALQGAGDLEAAMGAYRQAIRLRPDFVDAHNNLGFTLSRMGRFADAVGSFERVLAIEPGHFFALNNLGDALREQGKLAAAVEAYRRAVAAEPGLAEIHGKLGTVLRRQGKLSQALVCHQKALDLVPDSVPARYRLALALTELGNYGEAMKHLWASIDADPDFIPGRRALAAVMRLAVPTEYDARDEKRLLDLFGSTGVDISDLVPFATQLIKLKHGIGSGGIVEWTMGPLAESFLTDELVSNLLTRTVNIDSRLELVLIGLRRRLLFHHLAAPTDPTEGTLSAASVLAQQCFNNEYVFPVSSDERERIEQIANELEDFSDWRAPPSAELQTHLLLYSLYHPLQRLCVATRLREIPMQRWAEALRAPIRRSLVEPREEIDLDQEIPSIGTVADPTSRAVKEQYEENPYPRWLVPAYRDREPLQTILTRMFPHLESPILSEEPLRVLVAGCGTGYHPISVALRYENAEILATDISRRSLAYALRMARQLEVTNVTFVESDLLSASAPGDRFHVIECVGVLHHLKSPEQGLRKLLDRLEPNGLMKIGLYSRKAREPVIDAQQRIEASDLGPDVDDIRRLRHEALTAPEGDPLRPLLGFNDFYTSSSCRDLLFHVQEQCFTLAGIRDLLGRTGLEFIGFETADVSPHTTYRDRFPDDERMSDLSRWQILEEEHPTMFSAMYQFWCRRG